VKQTIKATVDVDEDRAVELRDEIAECLGDDALSVDLARTDTWYDVLMIRTEDQTPVRTKIEAPTREDAMDQLDASIDGSWLIVDAEEVT
jgi:hypothetical protein